MKRKWKPHLLKLPHYTSFRCLQKPAHFTARALARRQWGKRPTESPYLRPGQVEKKQKRNETKNRCIFDRNHVTRVKGRLKKSSQENARVPASYQVISCCVCVCRTVLEYCCTCVIPLSPPLHLSFLV